MLTGTGCKYGHKFLGIEPRGREQYIHKSIKYSFRQYNNKQTRSHPSSCPVKMSLELKKAMRGKRRSWCSMNTRTGMMLGSHRWFIKRLMLP